MSIKPSKQDRKTYDERMAFLEEVLSRQDAIHQRYEGAILAANEWIDEYNDAARALQEHVEEVAGELSSAFDDRSEKWQDSDAGASVQEMIDSWQDFDILFLDTIEEALEPFVDSDDLLSSIDLKWSPE